MASGQLTGLMGHLRRVAVAGASASTDAALLDAFIARADEAAFTALVHRHGPMVLGVCKRILPRDQDAEDAFQATFLVLVRKAHSLDRRDLLANWLYGVACRTARKARTVLARRHGREKPLNDMDQPQTADRMGVTDLRAWLDEAMERLPEKYRVALVLCELEGRSRKQAALALGLPEGTLSSRLARGRQLLADRLRHRGLPLSGAALAGALIQMRAEACVPTTLAQATVRAGLATAAGTAGLPLVSSAVAKLTEGVLKTMVHSKLKATLSVLVALVLFGAGAFPRPEAAPQRDPKPAPAKPSAAGRPAPRGRSVILLWMDGGPSQLDTFDLKPGQANGGPFKEIDTNVKGIRISEHLPKLARHMDKMAIVRSLTHRDGDHARATHLMKTGYAVQPALELPTIGAVLAKELGNPKSGVPDYVSIFPSGLPLGPAHLGQRFAPVPLYDLVTPELGALEVIDRDQAKTWSKSLSEAVDLAQEKAAIRDAYGLTTFGNSCLVARRLVERRVPVVEITMGGWDTHGDNFKIVKERSKELDAGWSALLTDLKTRGLLDTTLVVWMGEFGRTPRINANQGRDHWPASFTVVLAGGGIQGGQVVGSTKPDGAGVAQRPVTVPEFLATIYRLAGVDLARRYPAGDKGVMVPILDGRPQPIQEVLPKRLIGEAGKAAAELMAHVKRLAKLPAELAAAKGDDDKGIDVLFKTVLGRLPRKAEKAGPLKHLQNAKDRVEAYRDVTWALVNSNEFAAIHSLGANSETARQVRAALTQAWQK